MARSLDREAEGGLTALGTLPLSVGSPQSQQSLNRRRPNGGPVAPAYGGTDFCDTAHVLVKCPSATERTRSRIGHVDHILNLLRSLKTPVLEAPQFRPAIFALMLAGCVPQAQHDAVVRELAEARATNSNMGLEIHNLVSQLAKQTDGSWTDEPPSSVDNSGQDHEREERLRVALASCQAERTKTAQALELELQQRTAELPTGRRPEFSSSSSREFRIQAAVNDETFVIDGNVFKARTYCFGIYEGDRVIFIEGSGTGVCTSAKFIKVGSDRTCDVWCE